MKRERNGASDEAEDLRDYREISVHRPEHVIEEHCHNDVEQGREEVEAAPYAASLPLTKAADPRVRKLSK
ncbi:MAG: hypothetical protein M3Y72_20050 [Acidobacteriota bacterium]|nr:hypothetical protein [Acidobacteriota bacterium]